MFTQCFFSPADVLSDPFSATSTLLSVTSADELQLHFLMHSSLDICDEKVAAKIPQSVNHDAANTAAGSPQPARPFSNSTSDARFLDKVFQTNRWSVHAFHSCTAVRVLLVTVGDAPRDAVQPLCRHIYESASTALCNPFRELDDPLGSARFVASVNNIVYPFSVTSRSKIAP